MPPTRSMRTGAASLRQRRCCSRPGAATLLPCAAASYSAQSPRCHRWAGRCSCSLCCRCCRQARKQHSLLMSTGAGGCALWGSFKMQRAVEPATLRPALCTQHRQHTCCSSLSKQPSMQLQPCTDPRVPAAANQHSRTNCTRCICRCAVYVQDICSIVSHIITRAGQRQGQCAAAEQADSSSSGCVLAGLPHSLYNMVRPDGV